MYSTKVRVRRRGNLAPPTRVRHRPRPRPGPPARVQSPRAAARPRTAQRQRGGGWGGWITNHSLPIHLPLAKALAPHRLGRDTGRPGGMKPEICDQTHLGREAGHGSRPARRVTDGCAPVLLVQHGLAARSGMNIWIVDQASKGGQKRGTDVAGRLSSAAQRRAPVVAGLAS